MEVLSRPQIEMGGRPEDIDPGFDDIGLLFLV
jgi:hypothetical protein